jgi:hypothetical protein
MIPIRPDAPWGLWGTSRIVLLCAAHCSSAVAAPPRPASTAAWGIDAERGGGGEADFKFTHLTTNDGLSQGYVVDILQDRRGFMWFATRDGLDRYDGYTFVVYKHDPNDPGSLSSNSLQDLIEDDEGYLWVATSTGVNRFDPRTERCTRYLHDADNPDTLGGASVKSVVQDGRGYLWFGTEDSGLDKLDPRLRNAFRHAHAERVEVEIRYDDKEFRLHVRDDGKGVDPVVLASQGIEGHYGLRGMPERAALMGGKLAVWSEVGVGTEVELRLPAHAVYATSRTGSWLSRLFASRTPA